MIGLFGDPDRTRLSRLFHPRGEIDGVAHGCVLHAQVGAHAADDHQAGIDTHPYVDFDPPLAPDARTVAGHAVQDAQSGQDRSLGIIFVGMVIPIFSIQDYIQ